MEGGKDEGRRESVREEGRVRIIYGRQNRREVRSVEGMEGGKVERK